MKKFAIVLFILLFGVNLQAQTEKLPVHAPNSPMSLMEALQRRQTHRQFTEDKINPEQLSNVLWAAYGINRPKDSKRTAPSAINMQEMDIYVFTTEGIYLYVAEEEALELVKKGDYRADISRQEHFKVAPVSIVIVANYDRTKEMDVPNRDFYTAVDCGYVSQNIYLYCAAAELGTVACGAINRDKIASLIGLKNGKAMLAHPVGHIK